MKLNYNLTKIKIRLLFLTLAGVFVFSSLCSYAQSWAWAQNIGGTGTDRITDVTTDAGGNTYVCGTYNTAFSIGSYALPAMPGSNSVGCFVAKYNSSGVVQWVHTPVYGAYVNLSPTSITLDAAGNIYYGGLNQNAGSSVTFANGNANTVLTNISTFDGFIVKLNSSGVAQWASAIGYSSAGSINQMALHLDAFTGYLFFGASAATSNLAPVQYQNMNYRAPGSATNISMGTAHATGFQEAWYGRINAATGAAMEYYRLGAGNNATGQEWIEAIRTNPQTGDVYLATTIKNNTTLEYNGSTQTINSYGVDAGKIIKLNANLVFQVQSATFGSGATPNKLRAMALGTAGIAYIMDASLSTNDRSTLIGGFDPGLNSAWANTIGSAYGAGFFVSGKGIGYDAGGNIWATMGGYASGGFNWTFTPAYTAAQTTLGNMASNPGLVLLKLNYTSGNTAAWSDFSYIRENAANANSQGASSQTGKLATAGSTIYIAGSFNNTLTPPGLTAAAANGTNAYLMKFGCEPSFTTQPVNKLICGTGSQTIVLATVATGAGNTYQWQKNGTDVNGATNDTLTLTNPTIADTGTYTLIATNTCGNTTSSAAVVSFAAQPVITVQPLAGTVCNGSVTTLSVTATGNVTGYNWLYNNGMLGTNSVYSGANTATLQISGITAANAGVYSVNVNGNPNCPSVTSNSVTFTIATAPAITTDPADVTLCEGVNATIVSATVSGTAPAYQWYLGNTAINGATATTYSSTSVSTTDAGIYYLRATNQCGAANTQQATVNVTPIPQITSAFSNQSVCQGTNTTFSATDNSNGSYIYNFRWFKDNVNIGSGTSSFQYIPGTPSSSGTYFLTAGNACGADTSNSFVFTVNPTTAISTQPVAQSVCTGSSVAFTVSALGGNLTFQWKKNGNPIPNATSATYSIASVTANDAGPYTVEVSGDCGTATSNAAALTVATAASISQQPAGATLCSGDAINLSVIGTAGSNTTYQWRKDGVNIPYTAATLNLPGAQPFDGGAFDVVITGSCGTITSAVANVVVNQTTQITTQPAGGTFCQGTALNLSPVVFGTNLTYQWQKNGNNISGATQPAYNVAALTLADSGTYTLQVSGACGNLVSNNTVVVVNPLPTVTQQPQPLAVCPGSSASFSVAVNGTNTTYQWKFNGQNISGETAAAYTIPTAAAINAGDYTVAILDACGIFISDAATLTITSATNIIMQPATQTVCLGGNTQLSTIAGGTNLAYQWQLNGTDISGANTSTLDLNSITNAQLGNYTVVVTGTCGAVTSAAATIGIATPVSIVLQPTADVNELCAGGLVNLAVTVQGDNAAIQWKDNGANLSGANSNTLAVAPGTGVHYLHVSVTGTCSSVVSDSVMVTVHQLPQPTVAATGPQLTTQLYTAYQWQLNGNDINGATTQNYTAAANGNYAVFVTDTNGCSATSAAVNVTGLGVYDLPAASITVYPNPAAGVLNIQLATAGNTTIQVLSLEGKLIAQAETQAPMTTLNVSAFAPGTYLLGVLQNDKKAFTRFVKE